MNAGPAPNLTLDCIIFGLQRVGGISNYWIKLIEQAMSSPRLDTRLVMPKRPLGASLPPACNGGPATWRESAPARLTRYLRAHALPGTDLFHTSYYRRPRSKGATYIVTTYDFTYERYRTGLARLVHSHQKLASIRRADAVLCISESTRKDLLEFCPSVDPARVHVTHLGVDHKAFFPEAQRIEGMVDVLLFVGQRDGYKRFDLAVQAVRRQPRLRLGIVGPRLSDAERDVLRRDLGLRWQEFGPVDQQTLRALYSSAFAFVFPSDYEGFGLPVLEAMACGCPVVAANISSLPEVGGDAALYATGQQADAYAEQLARLEDATQRESLVGNGLARAAEFTWSKTFAQTLEVYLSATR
jgi:mannosyltransferase